MNCSLWQCYTRWHVLRVFFEDYHKWVKLCREWGIPVCLSVQEYQDCLYGTNADLYIPLWASVCKQPGASLLDATTRERDRILQENGISRSGYPRESSGLYRADVPVCRIPVRLYHQGVQPG